MRKPMKQLLKSLFLVLLCVWSLSLHADVFKGIVIDAETRQPLSGVTIKAVQSGQGSDSWTITNDYTSDSLGHFVANVWMEGRIAFTFSSIGYHSTRIVDYGYGMESSDSVDMGTIALHPTAIMLQKVQVSAKMPRITMSGDTVVFHPEAFKLEEGDRLDVLIRKLPGVEQRNGQLFWNGKPIRLKMNGKDVFGGGSILGQLPVVAADKIKLYEKQSELAKHTGNDDGDGQQVLDIQVKPNFLDKWFGFASADLRTKREYQVQLRASRLSDKNPVMAYGNLNNENYATAFGQSWATMWPIDYYGRNQYGTVNYQHNWELKGAKEGTENYINFGPSMAHRDGWGSDVESTDYFLPGQQRSFSLMNTAHKNHELVPSFNSEGSFYTDEKNQFSYNLMLEYTKGNRHNETHRAQFDDDPYQFADNPLAESGTAPFGSPLYQHLTMRDDSHVDTKTKQTNLHLDMHWAHFLGEKGRYGLGTSTTYKDDFSRMSSRRDVSSPHGLNYQMWQYGHNSGVDWQSSLSENLSYWFDKNFMVEVTNETEYKYLRHRNHFYTDTDAFYVVGDRPTTLDPANSLLEHTRLWKNSVKLGTLLKFNKKLMLKSNLSWISQRETTNYLRGRLDTVARRVSNIFNPEVKLQWKNGRRASFDLSWLYKTKLPELLSTLDYEDSTDPLYITMGNARLKREHDYLFELRHHRLFPRLQLNLMLKLSYGHTINPVVSAFCYNPSTGVYRTKPMNTPSHNRYNAELDYDQGLGISWRLHNKMTAEWARSYGYLLATNFNQPLHLNPLSRFTYKDNMELSYEKQSLSVKPYVEFTYNRYRYQASTINNSDLIRCDFGLKTVYTKDHFEFVSNVHDLFRSGYLMREFNGHRWLWDIDVVYKMLKNKAAIILKVADIFKRDTSFSNVSEAYSRTEKWHDTNHRYISISFGYQLDPKPQHK